MNVETLLPETSCKQHRLYVISRELDHLCKMADRLPAGDYRNEVVGRIAELNVDYLLSL